jgi:hypothetical protein
MRAWLLACSLGLGLLPRATLAAGGEHTYVVQQPALAVPLTLRKDGRMERVRINLPELRERIEIQPGRNVGFLPSETIDATLDTSDRSLAVRVRFDAARAVASLDGRVALERLMRVFEGDVEIASLTIKCTVDLFGLADEAAHATLRDARVEKLFGEAGVFAKAELAGGGVIATPVFPIELVTPPVASARANDRASSAQPTATIDQR